jgi:hypothetical protein
VALVMAISLFGISTGRVGAVRTEILHYQLGKLGAAQDVDMLLLGDSSLGNTIAAREWQQRLGRPVLSLALTGPFGYEGSLNMLRRSLRRIRPELIVFMHTLEQPTRRNSWEGLVYSAERVGDLQEAPLPEIVAGLASLDLNLELLIDQLVGTPPYTPGLVAIDYNPQRAAEAGGVDIDGHLLTPADLREDGMRTLARIAALCREAGVTCLYAHGPYVEPACSQNAAYLAAVNARIEQAGLRVVEGTPRCIPRAEAGDSEDHVAPALKHRYSEAYLERVLSAAGWPAPQATPAAH